MGQGGEDGADDVLMGAIDALDGDVGLGVDRIALTHQSTEDLARFPGPQQGPMIASLDPGQEEVERRPEPYRYRFFADHGPGWGIDEGAPAGRQDVPRIVEETRDHALLAVAKGRFSVAVEYFTDGTAGRRLDLGIGIDEGQAQTLREAAADGGFAGPHQANQDDRPIPGPGK